MEDFFDQLIAAVQREGARHPGHLVAPETFAALAPGAVRPAVPVPAASPAVPENPPASASGTAPGVISAASLEELAGSLAGCSRCPLAAGRHNIVFGEGNPHPRLMFIGEGPGYDEDRTGRPFVGRAGELLTRMIAAMGFRREEVYIANVVKCRPPDNRTPTPEEAAVCGEFLKTQIRLLAPEVMVLLGASAAHYLLGRREGISRLRGRWLEYEAIPVMPTFHPAYLLRQESAKRDAWNDLKQVMAKLGKPIPVPAARRQQ